MMMHKITPLVDERLDTQLNEHSHRNQIKSPKIVEPTVKKTIFKTLGTSVTNNCRMSSYSLSKDLLRSYTLTNLYDLSPTL